MAALAVAIEWWREGEPLQVSHRACKEDARKREGHHAGASDGEMAVVLPSSPPSPPPMPPVLPVDPLPRPAYGSSVVLTQATLFGGALVSSIACTNVIVKYCTYYSVRRPPLSLLFWRTVADLLFALQYLVTFFVQTSVNDETTFWGELPEYRGLCRAMSFYTQFTAFASEMWLLVICVDLCLSLTQPFRPNTPFQPKYHATVWLSSLASAVILLATDMQGASVINICWMKTAQDESAITVVPSENCSSSHVWSAALDWGPETAAMWYLFYVWVIAILTFCVFAVLFASARLWEGLQATYEVRLQTIKDLILYVGTSVIYWMAAASIYVALMFYCYPTWHWGGGEHDWQAGVLWSLMGLTIASKGGLNAVVWHWTAHRYIKVERGLHSPGSGRERKTFGAWDMPEALREEWLSYTQLGIRLAVAAAEEAAGTPKEHVPQRVVMLPSIRPDTDSPRISSTRDAPRSSTNSGFGAGSGAATADGAATNAFGPGQRLLPRVADAPVRRAPALAGGPASHGAARAPAAAARMEAAAAAVHDASTLEEDRDGRPLRWLFSCLSASAWSFFSSSAWMAFFAGGGPPFKFVEYHPGPFREMREADGVRPDVYLASLLSGGQVWIKRSKEGKGGRWRFSEGKSGSFMYYTHDRRLIVKTIDSSEAAILKAHAHEYTSYLRSQPGSYLTKFYGLYSISMYNTTMTFVVMGNIFYNAPARPVAETHLPEMDERYDLKGSWIDRNSSRPKDPHTVKKDNDLNYCLHLSSTRLAELRRQMATDVAFLASTLRTMDYSLIVGVRRGRFVVNTDGGQTHLTPIDGTEPTGAGPPAPPVTAMPPTAVRPSPAAVPASGGRGGGGSGAAAAASPPMLFGEASLASSLTLSGSSPPQLPHATLPPPPPSSSSSSAFVSPRASCSLTGAVLGTVSPLLAHLPSYTAGGAAAGGVGSGHGLVRRPSEARPTCVTDSLGVVPLECAAPGSVTASASVSAAAAAAAATGRPESPYPHSIEYAIIVEGPQSYYLGLIDVLQTWSLRKRLEHFGKVWLPPWRDGQGISAVPPGAYAERFLKRVVYDVFDAPLSRQDELRLLGGGSSLSPHLRPPSAAHYEWPHHSSTWDDATMTTDSVAAGGGASSAPPGARPSAVDLDSSESVDASCRLPGSSTTMMAPVATTTVVPSTSATPSTVPAGDALTAGAHAAPCASGPLESERIPTPSDQVAQ